MKPYIGVTGFKTKDEVNEISGIAKEIGYPHSHTVMFGYLTSSKRCHDILHGGKRSPAVVDLPQIVSATPTWAVSMLHYFTEDKSALLPQVNALVYASRANAVQLNVVWPDIASIEQLKKNHPNLDILLQLPEHSTQGLTNLEIIDRAKDYAGLLSYILIDPSAGQGKDFDILPGAGLMNQLGDALPKAIVGIAGGFTPDNVSKRVLSLNDLVKKPYFIDAETGIMTNNSIDAKKSALYLQRGFGALR